MRIWTQALTHIWFSYGMAFAECGVPTSDIDIGDGWSAGEIYEYPDERLGASREFFGRGSSVTYYTYDLGLQEIDPNVLRDQLNQAVSQIISSARQNDENVELYEPQLLPDSLYSHLEGFMEVAVMVPVKSGALHGLEVVGLGSDGTCLHKVRFTSLLPSFEADDRIPAMKEFSTVSPRIYFRIIEDRK